MRRHARLTALVTGVAYGASKSVVRLLTRATAQALRALEIEYLLQY
jgi:hypothetical protein